MSKIFSMNKMKFSRNKGTIISIALILLLAISSLAILSSTVSAHDPEITIPSYVYLNAYPPVIGVGQTVNLLAWSSIIPPTANGQYGDRWTGLTITVNAPDNTTTTLGPFISDPVGAIFEYFVPTMTGTYSFQYHQPAYKLVNVNPNPDPTASYNRSPYINDTYTAADSEVVTIEVTNEQLPGAPAYPLPSEYWTNPVAEGGHMENWLYIMGDYLATTETLSVIHDNTSPILSSHIAWTKPINFGGVAGLPSSAAQGDGYYSYLSYETMFNPGIIMNGRLYYNTPNPPEYGFTCVDLRTGETLWYNNGTQDILAVQQRYGSFAKQNYPQLSFGQEINYNSPNQEGVLSYLWSTYTAENGSSVWAMYDPFTGNWIMDIINVPPTSVRFGATSLLPDDNGNYLIYTVDPIAKTISVFNNTQCIQESPASKSQANGYWMWRPELGGILDASLGTTVYSLTGTLPAAASTDALMYMDKEDQLAILGNATSVLGTRSYPTPDAYNLYAVSIAPATMGQIMWSQTYPWPAGNITLLNENHAIGNGVFAMYEKENRIWQAFDTTTGAKLWRSTTPETQDHMYGVSAVIYNGLLLSGDASGTGGVLYAYDAQTGTPVWNYQAPAMNNTGYWPYIPIRAENFGAGLVYWYGSEHSPGGSLEPGMMIGANNATTGAPIWNITFWSGGGPKFATADGYGVALNIQDQQIYSFGKGPTATTLQTPLAGVIDGQSFTVQGTVTDISAGASQTAIKARFPNGLPAVSDDSMTAWMEYVYMQNPKPASTTGVEVSINAFDPNGNYVNLGTTHSDTNGYYAFEVTPDMTAAGPGTYTVIASFAGSNSYWPSQSESSFTIGATAATPAPTEAPVQSAADMYFVPAIAGLFVLIIVVAIVLALLMLRKK